MNLVLQLSKDIDFDAFIEFIKRAGFDEVIIRIDETPNKESAKDLIVKRGRGRPKKEEATTISSSKVI